MPNITRIQVQPFHIQTPQANTLQATTILPEAIEKINRLQRLHNLSNKIIGGLWIFGGTAVGGLTATSYMQQPSNSANTPFSTFKIILSIFMATYGFIKLRKPPPFTDTKRISFYRKVIAFRRTLNH
jgi:hypothetical protein